MANDQTARIRELLPTTDRRKTRIGLVAGGLAAYWPQFPELLPLLQRSSDYVSGRFSEMDAEVIERSPVHLHSPFPEACPDPYSMARTSP